jgi:GTPase SAR1 family protein
LFQTPVFDEQEQGCHSMPQTSRKKNMEDNAFENARGKRMSGGYQKILEFSSNIKEHQHTSESWHLAPPVFHNLVEEEKHWFEEPVKIIVGVMGETKVGKTSLIIQMCQNKFIGRQASSQVDKLVTKVDEKECIIEFVDCESEFLDSTLHMEELTKMNVFLFVFDSETSATEQIVNHNKVILSKLNYEFQNRNPSVKLHLQDLPIVLVFNNKSDSKAEASYMLQLLSKKYPSPTPFLAVNNKTGEHFDLLLKQIVRQYANKKLAFMRKHSHENHCHFM